MPTKYFTPEEADALLPKIRTIMGDILSARGRIIAARPDLIPVLEKAAFDGGSRRAGGVIWEFERIQRGMARIHAMGAQVKDINQGLVDFPHRREGKEVLLCWQYGEEKIGYWHDLESGFQGRQPL